MFIELSSYSYDEIQDFLLEYDDSGHSVPELIKYLIDATSYGGELLMNVITKIRNDNNNKQFDFNFYDGMLLKYALMNDIPLDIVLACGIDIQLCEQMCKPMYLSLLYNTVEILGGFSKIPNDTLIDLLCHANLYENRELVKKIVDDDIVEFHTKDEMERYLRTIQCNDYPKFKDVFEMYVLGPYSHPYDVLVNLCVCTPEIMIDVLNNYDTIPDSLALMIIRNGLIVVYKALYNKISSPRKEAAVAKYIKLMKTPIYDEDNDERRIIEYTLFMENYDHEYLINLWVGSVSIIAPFLITLIFICNRYNINFRQIMRVLPDVPIDFYLGVDYLKTQKMGYEALKIILSNTWYVNPKFGKYPLNFFTGPNDPLYLYIKDYAIFSDEKKESLIRMKKNYERSIELLKNNEAHADILLITRN